MRRIVVIANRLPVARKGDQWVTSPGGLVRALEPVLQRVNGSWVGWSGDADLDLEPFEHDGIDQIPVPLSSGELDDFYFGFCNSSLWPLYHDAIVAPEFHRHQWYPYVTVNRRYAESAAAALRGDDDVAWVQDYQLQLVPGMLRELRPEATIGFYLHIPFPPIELFSRLPWRRQIIEGLLGADVLAFQTRASVRNFARAARKFARADVLSTNQLKWQGRSITLQRAPIAIDTAHFEQLARSDSVRARATELRHEMGNAKHIILGVDRLDYTKGIDLRLQAFAGLLERTREPGEYAFVQVAVPSREDVPAYQDLRAEIEQLVGRINGDHGEPGWSPISYLYRSLDLEELIAYYVAADVMLVTPLRDGMNLVAKEYVATRVADPGVLILSEFAGAAEQLRSALVVNPFDVDEVTATIYRATMMERREARTRMQRLRRTVRREDVFEWARVCLAMLDAV